MTNTQATNALTMNVMVSMKEVVVNEESGAAFWTVSALASMLAVAVATLI